MQNVAHVPYAFSMHTHYNDQFVIFWENDELQIDGVFLFIRRKCAPMDKYFSITLFLFVSLE